MVDRLFPDPITNDPQHLHFHAIGLTTAIWNRLEDYVDICVLNLSGLNHKSPIAPILEKTGNVSKADLLYKLAAQHGWQKEGLEGLAHFITAFNICRENRNIVMHSRFGEPEYGEDFTRMFKPSSSGALLAFSSELEDLRQIARDTLTTLHYFRALTRAGSRRGPIMELIWGKTRPGHPLPAWPERPPLPRKLNPLPPATDPQGG